MAVTRGKHGAPRCQLSDHPQEYELSTLQASLQKWGAKYVIDVQEGGSGSGAAGFVSTR